MAVDVEKLKKELDRKTKSYEGKLATLTAINSALQTENDKLRKQLAQAAKPTTAADEEVEELKEEFARRLGAADRQIAILQDDKDRLRQQLQMASQGGTASEARLHEKDDHIRTLQIEGEKLSRRNGELEATARKLRTQMRDVEADRDRLATRLAGVEAQLAEQTQRTSQAELALQEQAAAHDAELLEMRHAAAVRMTALEQQAQSEVHRSLEQAARDAAEGLSASIEREAALSQNIAELRAALDDKEEREADLRGEMATLDSRVRELEAVNQALQANTTDATKPLLRQIESLAASASVQQQVARETEHRLSQRVKQCEAQLAEATESQRAAVARAEAAEGAAAAARDAAHSAAAAVAEVKARCEAEQARCTALQQQVHRLEQQLRAAAEASSKSLEAKEADIQLLQERLWDAEEQLRSIAAEQHAEHQPQHEQQAAAARLNGALQQQGEKKLQGDAVWHRMTRAASRGARLVDEGNERPTSEDVSRQPPEAGGVADGEDEMEEMLRSISMHSAPMLPLSPSKSSTVDKEASRVQQLEAQLVQLEQARDSANEALVQALGRVAALEADAKRVASLKRQLQEMQTKHTWLLEVLGERNERVEQLEEDARDMKQIFHHELEVAVDQLQSARQALEKASLANAAAH